MPTLLDEDGFKFFFYANEHLPEHVHVTKGDAWARISLATLDASDVHMRRPDLRRALELATAHRNEFLRRWHEFFGAR